MLAPTILCHYPAPAGALKHYHGRFEQRLVVSSFPSLVRACLARVRSKPGNGDASLIGYLLCRLPLSHR